MAQNTKQWLESKKYEFNKDNVEALKNMLITTTEVIEQYLNSESKAARGVLEACLKHNNLYINEVLHNVQPVCDHNWKEYEDVNCNANLRCTKCKAIFKK